jgi:hypothetical protein
MCVCVCVATDIERVLQSKVRVCVFMRVCVCLCVCGSSGVWLRSGVQRNIYDAPAMHSYSHTHIHTHRCSPAKMLWSLTSACTAKEALRSGLTALQRSSEP